MKKLSERLQEACNSALHEACVSPLAEGTKRVNVKNLTIAKTRSIQREVIRFCELSHTAYLELPSWWKITPEKEYDLIITAQRIWISGGYVMCISFCITWH